MDYEFSWGSFLLGIILTTASVVVLRFHRRIADEIGGGLSSYERFQLFSLIGIVLGIIVMLNLHLLILYGILSLFF